MSVGRQVGFMGKGSVESLSRAQMVIGQNHAQVHLGQAFQLRLVDAALINTDVIELEMITPAVGAEIHVKEMEFYTDQASAHIELIEAPTITDGTNPVPILNKNRNSDKVSEVIAWDDPTSISAGTLLDEFYFGGGTFPKPIGGIGNDDWEWVFLEGTKYLLRLTNDSGATAIVFMRVVWYELPEEE